MKNPKMQQMRQREKKNPPNLPVTSCRVSSSSSHVVWGPEDKHNELPENRRSRCPHSTCQKYGGGLPHSQGPGQEQCDAGHICMESELLGTPFRLVIPKGLATEQGQARNQNPV